ncbi:VWA domain-containing protein [Saccharibacter floricola]|uniref:VWFA domain-containing protein n=1 Tax=Saccharibacter floricola DSM 15669 TaxID=1123227 RepID=A0ABQ0NXP6_9PROT|nr:VWA domain-containing protein [Saccharibacter floricola]GBQ05323.1 hypothetical protein AA15669_0409 [Saccharibacter floricola DSM 15669]
MSDLVFDLSKKLEFQLEKNDVSRNISLRVGFALDASSSMEQDYASGRMTRLNERILPVALRFDDNRSLEVCAFSKVAYALPDMTAENYQTYIADHIMRDFYRLSGATYFAPALAYFIHEWGKKTSIMSAVRRFFTPLARTEPSEDPGYIILQTDGCNFDNDETIALIQSLKENNIFVTFITTGPEANRQRTEYYAQCSTNVATLHIEELSSVSDDCLYASLVSPKLVTWLHSL